jgi:AraC-like DNA-binding protein
MEDTNEDRTHEPLPSPLDIILGRVRRELEQHQPERAVDIILNMGPEYFATEPPKRRSVPAATAEQIREAIRLHPRTTAKVIAETLGCHIKTVRLQRRLMQKQVELRQASASGR